MDNPWREFIENCISGDNYFRASEYMDLLTDLDRGYAAEERLAHAEACLAEKHLRLAEAEALLREARAGVKNSAVQFGYPYTEYVDRIDAFLAPADSASDKRHPGYIIGDHWLQVAYERICAGEDEFAVLADYGMVRTDQPTVLEEYFCPNCANAGCTDCTPELR